MTAMPEMALFISESVGESARVLNKHEDQHPLKWMESTSYQRKFSIADAVKLAQ